MLRSRTDGIPFQGRSRAARDLPAWARGGIAAGCILCCVSELLLLIAAWNSGLAAPAPTLLVRDREGRFVGELAAQGDDRLGFWPLAEVPERVAQATLAIEDRRFARHPGVDPIAVARAFLQNVRSERRVSGASTLAMQVARMQRPGARGYLRKSIEAATALLLTGRHGRDAVLRHYLTIVPYGHRIHGIAFAARRYLDKPVDDLSWAEIAFLSAIPQSSSRMDPYDPAGRARAIRRGREILDRLHRRGALSANELAAAADEIGRIAFPWRASRPEAGLHALLHFERLVATEERARRPLVTSTLDLELQREVEWLAYRAVADAADRGAGNAAVMVVDRATWNVVAAVSSTGYFDDRRAGAIDYLRLERSPGSTLKPLLYALALDRGEVAPNTILDDLAPGPSGILNADGRFLGPMLPRAALGNSRNVPAVALVAKLGLESSYGFLGELGLHRHERPARRYGLGIAIGSLPVTLEHLVTAYTALAGDGTLRSPRWIAGAEDSAPRRVLQESTARLVTQFLADPQARLPSFPRMGFAEYPYAVAVKTGTSSRYRDAWTIAWSRRYLAGVWVGHPDERPMTELSGYRVAARLTHDLFDRLHSDLGDGLADVDFPAPRGFVAVRLCALSGRRAGAWCDRVALEWLAPEVQVTDCTAHRRQGESVVVELPSRYSGWLAAQGVPTTNGLSSAAGGDAVATRALAGFERIPNVQVTSPEPGARLLRDPETPAGEGTLALRAIVEPEVAQLVWYVDGLPFRTVEAPFEARWPLQPGEHWFQARVPFSEARSAAVRVRID